MAWNTENKPFDFYSSDFDTETAEVKCDGCSEVFDWSDKERGSGDEIPICSQVCYEKFYSEEEEEIVRKLFSCEDTSDVDFAEHKKAMEDTLNYIKWDLTECDDE